MSYVFREILTANICSVFAVITGTATFVMEEPTGTFVINSSLWLPDLEDRELSEPVVLTGWPRTCPLLVFHKALIHVQKVRRI
jgi:hypothetical protein